MTGDNESTMTAGHMTDPHALASPEVALSASAASSSSSAAGVRRSTADNNLIIMLNGEMVFGKRDGEHPLPRPNVLRGGVVPHRSALAASPAIVAGDGVREAASSLRVHADSSEGDDESRIFDQSSFGAGSEDGELGYDHRPISPIGDASSVGSLQQQLAREIDGSYFSSQAQPPRRHTQGPTSRSVLSASGMARISDLSSDDSDDDQDGAPRRFALSTPYRAIQLENDWVKAWGEAWGLSVNKAEEQKRVNRLSRLQAKREQARKSMPLSPPPLTLQVRSPAPSPASPTKRGDGPSVAAVLQEGSLAKAVAQATSPPPPSGPRSPVKSPWGDRTMEWAEAEDTTLTPRQASTVDLSMASAENTVKKKSKWVFGDNELSEDEQDEQLGEENRDGEEAWTRSAKKQFRSIEPFRKLPPFESAADIVKAAALAQRKQGNPHSIRKHAMSAHEQRVISAGAEDEDLNLSQKSFLTYTPDIAKLRLQREKLRRGEYDDEDESRPLFRRNDGRLVRRLKATALDDLVAPPTTVDLGHQDRVGAWV